MSTHLPLGHRNVYEEGEEADESHAKHYGELQHKIYFDSSFLGARQLLLTAIFL